jgi:glucose-1-phosphate cytidylyltransferase
LRKFLDSKIESLVSGAFLELHQEKPFIPGWIIGGFFVFEPQNSNYLNDLAEPLESGALPRLIEEKQLVPYNHNDLWQLLDTKREKIDLERHALLNPPSWLTNL